MTAVSFRFYAELNEHLPDGRRQVRFIHPVSEGSTVREAIAALGVPVNEIDLLLVNGQSGDLSYCPNEGDFVSVFPTFDAIDVGPITRIENRPPRRMRFVLDVHLGKLAHHLRMLGFDTLYRNDYRPIDLLDIACREDRILLSKGKKLVENSDITAGYRIRSSDPREQLIEVLVRFDLWSATCPFTRCLHCNTILLPAQEQDLIVPLPEKVRSLFRDFNRCPSCQRIYWQGSHFGKMKTFIDGIVRRRAGELPEGL